MTQQNLLNVQAGTRVMQWGMFCEEGKQPWFIDGVEPLSQVMLVSDFSPTTRIEHAFLLEQKLREQGFVVVIVSNQDGYCVKFEGKESEGHADDKLLSKAITIAALAACGVAVE